MYILLPLYSCDYGYDYCYKTDELTVHPSPDAAMKQVYHDLHPDEDTLYWQNPDTSVWTERYKSWDKRWRAYPHHWVIQFDAADGTELWGYEIVKAANR